VVTTHGPLEKEAVESHHLMDVHDRMSETGHVILDFRRNEACRCARWASAAEPRGERIALE
jgi:hypothetical protein